mgnify:CR=1 FL=1|tara:strand:- start:4078 stop:4464 length:387 start_codon:yes stop_codon:yes gene_type:complete
MKTFGVGVDIIDNSRIKKSITNKRFLEKIYSEKEIFNSKKTKNKTEYFSKRFAAKEAFSKALGTGFRNNLSFNDITVLNDKYGKPFIMVNKKLKKILSKKFKTKNVNIFLSLSDEKKHSIAFVVVEKK